MFARSFSAAANCRPSAEPHAAWNAALNACRQTQAAVQAAQDAGSDTVVDARHAYNQMIDLLVVTPAPDQAALLTKIEFLACGYAAFAIEAMLLKAVVADARRLLVEG